MCHDVIDSLMEIKIKCIVPKQISCRIQLRYLKLSKEGDTRTGKNEWMLATMKVLDCNYKTWRFFLDAIRNCDARSWYFLQTGCNLWKWSISTELVSQLHAKHHKEGCVHVYANGTSWYMRSSVGSPIVSGKPKRVMEIAKWYRSEYSHWVCPGWFSLSFKY